MSPRVQVPPTGACLLITSCKVPTTVNSSLMLEKAQLSEKYDVQVFFLGGNVGSNNGYLRIKHKNKPIMRMLSICHYACVH